MSWTALKLNYRNKVFYFALNFLPWEFLLKFMFSKKAAKIDEIFTVNLTLCSECQIDGEDFVNFYGLLRKHKLYENLINVFASEINLINYI